MQRHPSATYPSRAVDATAPLASPAVASAATAEAASGPAFLIHNEGDSVAVATRDVEPGEHDAVYMDSNRTIAVSVLEPIPLGHKLALANLAEGADVIEYGVRIGLTRMPIRAGQLVHTHNIRSARWQNSL